MILPHLFPINPRQRCRSASFTEIAPLVITLTFVVTLTLTGQPLPVTTAATMTLLTAITRFSVHLRGIQVTYSSPAQGTPAPQAARGANPWVG